jgi:hypothetical protein
VLRTGEWSGGETNQSVGSICQVWWKRAKLSGSESSAAVYAVMWTEESFPFWTVLPHCVSAKNSVCFFEGVLRSDRGERSEMPGELFFVNQ